MGGSSLNSRNVASSNFSLDVALGKVPGVSGLIRTGFNDTITNTPEDVWTIGGQQVFLTAAETMSVASTDAADTSAGTGARTVLMEGLDNNFDEISETITLNGTTPVITVNSYIRLLDMTTITAGSDASNQGDITATATGSGDPQNQIRTAGNKSLAVQFTVPNGKTALLLSLTFSAGTNDAMIFSLFTRSFGGLFTIQNVEQIIGSAFDFEAIPYADFSEKSDIRMIANQLSGGGTTSSSAIMQFFIVDN